MKEVILRLRAIANEAMTIYNDLISAGGSPPAPQFAMDLMEVCRHIENHTSRDWSLERRPGSNPIPLRGFRPPAPPAPPPLRLVREDQNPGAPLGQELLAAWRKEFPGLTKFWQSLTEPGSTVWPTPTRAASPGLQLETARAALTYVVLNTPRGYILHDKCADALRKLDEHQGVAP